MLGNRPHYPPALTLAQGGEVMLAADKVLTF